ncbi:iron chelate uptake ABC transporter family permease subunit [Tistrella mobilis]|uniref:iron chelate uptake ABC transporter family permease subunit n=1 Tax=Tistrella mobilis TaxID=171437 RepID=UPI003558148D
MIFDAFLLRALAGGIGLALVMGPLGCFVVWRRMAYFGDTLAHSALLGITLGTVTGLGFGPGIVIACLSVAVLLVMMKRRQPLAEDTLLGILAHSALSLGLVAMALAGNPRVDLMAYLFGDILAIHGGDLWSIWLGGAAVLAVLALLWRRLLTITVDEDLARVEGVPVLGVQLAFMALIALVIALAMKIVGVLLVTSLLVIPAAAARRLAPTPEAMAVIAALTGAVAVTLGLGASLLWDLPSGPAVVVAAAMIFGLVTLLPQRLVAP